MIYHYTCIDCGCAAEARGHSAKVWQDGHCEECQVNIDASEAVARIAELEADIIGYQRRERGNLRQLRKRGARIDSLTIHAAKLETAIEQILKDESCL